MKEIPPIQGERLPQEQHGFSERDADRIYEDAFRDGLEGGSDIDYELPHVIARVFERQGWRLEKAERARLQADRPHVRVFEVSFRTESENEDDALMHARLAVEFTVDAEKGTAIFSIVPLEADPGHPRVAEAGHALSKLSGVLTLAASEKIREAMRQLAGEEAHKKEERREGLVRLKAFAQAHAGREFKPEDYLLHKAELRREFVPEIDEGTWSFSRYEDGWRFVWWAQDRSKILDARDFPDGED